MIPEEHVTFESAKLLKEAGFPQESRNYYDVDGNPIIIRKDKSFAAPTQAQAMRWLREKHSIHVDISPAKDVTWVLWLVILKKSGFYNIHDVIKILENIPTYEAAAEAGIQAACQYLIDKQNDHDKD